MAQPPRLGKGGECRSMRLFVQSLEEGSRATRMALLAARRDLYVFAVIVDIDSEHSQVIASEQAIDVEFFHQIEITDRNLDALQLSPTDVQGLD